MMRANDDERIGGALPPRRRPLLFAVLAVALLAALGFGLRALMQSTEAPLQGSVTLTPPGTAPSTARGPGTKPAPLPAPVPSSTPPAIMPELKELPLPELEHSDAEVRASLSDVLPALAQPALAPDELLRRAAVLADNFARGKLLRDKLPLPAPAGKPVLDLRGDRIYLSPQNYARYNALADAFVELDADALARWFSRYEPLLQQAWSELGNGQGSVRGALIAGLDLALAAPDLEGDIELVQPAVFYRYADPALEALPDTQKLLIRIGPANRAVVKSRLRRLRDALASATGSAR